MHFFSQYAIIRKLETSKYNNMQRWLSGLRRTIGKRVMQKCIRRFKSSSLRHENGKYRKGISRFCIFKQEEDLRGGKGETLALRSANSIADLTIDNCQPCAVPKRKFPSESPKKDSFVIKTVLFSFIFIDS